MKKFVGTIALLAFFLIFAPDIKAQYGYGGGFGGGGFRNRLPSAGDDAKPKEPNLDPEKLAEEDTRWMKKKLKLTEEQIPKVENINIDYAFKRIDLYEEMKKMQPPFTEEMRTKIRDKFNAMKEGKNKDMKAVLTDEQYEIYLKKKQD
ncbi:MAG: hypothetical protein MUF58_10520 [Arcicella sp.]|jgi:hypothetical protein|nr:hypothetical protein [Arcicella sp.]